MYTVRQLITEAFRKSTVRGLTDTPEAEEVRMALETLNTELDGLTANAEFSPSRRAVRAVVGSEGYVTIADDQKRVIVSAEATVYGIKLNTGDAHGMSVGDAISVRIDGHSGIFEATVIQITGPYSFNTTAISGITGTFSGTFKMSSKGPEYDIGILDCPPDNIYQVISDDGRILPELQEQDFYANRHNRNFDWFFYDKSRNPYPKVWVGGRASVTIVYTEPFWHDLKLDTDLTMMPKSARTAIKYMLAENIADENGYTDIADRMHRKYMENYAAYCRSVDHSASPLPDLSAPGYFNTGHYNIENDGGPVL